MRSLRGGCWGCWFSRATGSRTDGRLYAEIESEIQSATVEQRIADINVAEERLRLTQEGVRAEDRSAMIAAWEAAHNDAESGTVSVGTGEAAARARLCQRADRFGGGAQALGSRAGSPGAQMRAQAGQAGGRPAEVGERRANRFPPLALLCTADRVQLARTRIVAPVAGVVMTRNVNPGDIIGASVTSPILFKLVDPLRVEVRPWKWKNRWPRTWFLD